ncbi:MAG: type II/IV secretion system protein [Deltaproteobacteria bacterium]|nr:type II/IV secretion system protein [Deltaproteobacteria bacterium]
MASSFDKTVSLLKRAGILNDSVQFESSAVESFSPVRYLARNNLVNEVIALEYLALAQGTELVDLVDGKIAKRLATAEYLPRISENLIWAQKLIPLFEEDGKILVAFADILDYEVQKTVEFNLNAPIKPVAAEEVKIVKLLQHYCPRNKVGFDKIDDEPQEALEIIGAQREEENIDQIRSDTPPIVKLVNKIIADAIKKEASDVHIEPTNEGLNIRFRIDGVLQDIFDVPRRLQPLVVSRIKILAGMDIAERRKPQDGRLRVSTAGAKIDLRASCVPTAHGEKIVLRLLASEGADITFRSLNFPQRVQNSLEEALTQRGKMILVSGPTGSGKTTTLYGALTYLRDGLTSIQTVEDPIEFRVPGITQIQVNPLAGVTFSSALRSILRQDPDVIMVGEIRDEETADIAMQAAQTGHLVLSTLHTNDAPSAITRLLNLGCKPYIIANSVAAIMAQRLVRKICSDCKVPVNEEYLTKNSEIIRGFEINPSHLFHGVGCAKCNGTGYRGRIGLYSYLNVDDIVAEGIAQDLSLAEVTRRAASNGFVTIGTAALEVLNNEISTLEELRPYLVSALNSDQHKEYGGANAATVKVTVPNAFESNASAPAAVGIPSKVSKPKVLLVDDDDNVRAVLALLLKREMFDVVEARNGMEALERIYEGVPQIVLLDLMMPEMDGREFLTRARAIEGVSRVPIVVLTAVDSEKNEVELLNLGATDFIRKTSSSGIIATRIRTALRR